MNKISYVIEASSTKQETGLTSLGSIPDLSPGLFESDLWSLRDCDDSGQLSPPLWKIGKAWA